MGSSDCSMPLSDSADLILVVPTPAERIECLKANSREWKGVLDADQYVQRENHLMNQDMTKDGAMTLWILVDRHFPPDNRPILSSCESFSKRAWLAHDGKVEQILAHGEDSVRKRGVFFCPLFGYRQIFFMRNVGWKAFPSSHISLPPVSKDKGKQSVSGVDLDKAGEMQADDVRRLMCSDAALEKYQQILREASHNSKRAKVAFVPDYAALSWHWAREEFYSKILFPGKGEPKVKGACVESRKVFICWNRNFGSTEKDNVLFILRTLYEEPRSPAEEKAVVEALAAALYCAQLEAHEWGRSRVDIWNPTPVVEKAVKMLSPTAQIEHREQTSICSLKWNGKQLGLGEDIDWYWNEKYAWC
ncbi:conserved hypothetical protein [Histoplasma capsulatum H143]|uniref:LYC1 C-terminal domain-containing protein n=1 Tax=Ajellomyces capsulatus (strain H143) TaxID=544712 RepID=C6HMK3_AJECH|nr:conserved hypothetical protein [Histoplasma capsulatum H143]